MSRTITPAAALVMNPEKAGRVQAELERLRGLFDGADENKKDFIRDAVQQLAWLGITIQELQADVDERGPVVPYQNGKGQSGLQANPACKILKDYQQLHNTLFRALLPVLPERMESGGKLAALNAEFADLGDYCESEEEKQKREEHEKAVHDELERAIEQQRREREQAERGKA